MIERPLSDTTQAQSDDDFTLNTAQMVFMININPAAEKADQEDNFSFFDDIIASAEWKNLFGEMSWDQAYDRYEIMLGQCNDC